MWLWSPEKKKKKVARAFILTRAQEFNSNNYIIHPKDKSIPLEYCLDHDVYSMISHPI
jgi:hypothetical protein